MLQHDSPIRKNQVGLGRKASTTMSIDYDLTNTATSKSGYHSRRELKRKKSSTSVSHNVSTVYLHRVRIDHSDILTFMMCQGFITVVVIRSVW